MQRPVSIVFQTMPVSTLLWLCSKACFHCVSDNAWTLCTSSPPEFVLPLSLTLLTGMTEPHPEKSTTKSESLFSKVRLCQNCADPARWHGQGLHAQKAQQRNQQSCVSKTHSDYVWTAPAYHVWNFVVSSGAVLGWSSDVLWLLLDETSFW